MSGSAPGSTHMRPQGRCRGSLGRRRDSGARWCDPADGTRCKPMARRHRRGKPPPASRRKSRALDGSRGTAQLQSNCPPRSTAGSWCQRPWRPCESGCIRERCCHIPSSDRRRKERTRSTFYRTSRLPASTCLELGAGAFTFTPYLFWWVVGAGRVERACGVMHGVSWWFLCSFIY